MVDLLRVISLGAGVQSTTMALMAAKGELGPMPDCAIFADTQWEPAAVYKHLEWLETQLPFPVHHVTKGSLPEYVGSKRPNGGTNVAIPVYILHPDGPGGLLLRECTREFKIRPIVKKLRELTGLGNGRKPKHAVVEQWIGISTDEAARMKPSREAWVGHRWPLIEQRMSRQDCLRWMERNAYPRPAKSSCIGCPFHSDAEWRALTPDEFGEAVALEKKLQAAGKHRTKGIPFLHRSCVQLDQVDFSTAEDRGQLNLFNNECEGMCGV